MKKYLLALVALTASAVYANGSKPPDLGENQYEVNGYASQTGPRSGTSCQLVERKALTDMQNNCAALGVGARLLRSNIYPCSCMPTNDRMFERCSASAYGVCEVN